MLEIIYQSLIVSYDVTHCTIISVRLFVFTGLTVLCMSSIKRFYIFTPLATSCVRLQ